MTESTGIPKLNPLNLALRFALEVGAVVAIVSWGASLAVDWKRYLIAGALVTGALTIWGVFNVEGDPSRSGNAPVSVPGWLRLLIEWVVLGGGALCTARVWFWWAGLAFGALIAVHYAISWKRMAWLLKS